MEGRRGIGDKAETREDELSAPCVDRVREMRREREREREEERERERQKGWEREREWNQEIGGARGSDAGGYRRDDQGQKDGGRRYAHGGHRDCYGREQSRVPQRYQQYVGINMDINRQIMRAPGASELCTFIEARVADFNHVNVATAFRKLLQSRRDG